MAAEEENVILKDYIGLLGILQARIDKIIAENAVLKQEIEQLKVRVEWDASNSDMLTAEIEKLVSENKQLRADNKQSKEADQENVFDRLRRKR